MKRCFVISPIGEEGSEIREHADAVFDYIIKPAMKECGIDARRADHIDRLGRISDQMFEAILKDDLCIAVLAFSNPNVFYELAIAQAAARPVIILVPKGQELPFDLQGLRAVTYDLRPKPLFEREYANRIIANVKELDAAGWKVNGIIPGWSPALGCDFSMFEQGRHFEAAHGWMSLLEGTAHHLDLMGLSLTTWRRLKGARTTILKKADEGCNVRVLIVHPDNPCLTAASHLVLPAERAQLHLRTAARLEEGRQFYVALAAEHANIQMRQIVHGFPHCHLSRTDDWVVSTQYLWSERVEYCPAMRVGSRSPLYQQFVQEFDTLWQSNSATGGPSNS